jgi:hypothetical protein
MFLVDDVLAYPVKSILSIFVEIYKAAQQELRDEADEIRTELSRLYLLLEAGTLEEQEFDAREKELLDRLDTIEATVTHAAEDEADELDEDDEDDDFDDDEDDDTDVDDDDPLDEETE